MEQLVPSLIEVLRQTETLYDRLLGLIEIEKAAVLASDIDQLTSTGHEKENLLGQLGRLERRRSRIQQHLAGRLHLPEHAVTLSRLAIELDAPHKHQLQQTHQRLKRLVEKVCEANEQCRELIRHCLRLVHNNLGFFQHWMDSAKVYGASGDMRGAARAGGRLLSGCV